MRPPERREKEAPRTRLDRGRGALGPALELVHTGRAPTRAVLTAELGVTRATAGAVAAELEALGLIHVDARPGAAAGSQGRPSHRLERRRGRPRGARRPGARRRLPRGPGRPRRPDRRHRTRLRDRRRRPGQGARLGRRGGRRTAPGDGTPLRGRGPRRTVGRRRTRGHRPQPPPPGLAGGRTRTGDLRGARPRGRHHRTGVRGQRRQPRRTRRAPARRGPRLPRPAVRGDRAPRRRRRARPRRASAHWAVRASRWKSDTSPSIRRGAPATAAAAAAWTSRRTRWRSSRRRAATPAPRCHCSSSPTT